MDNGPRLCFYGQVNWHDDEALGDDDRPEVPDANVGTRVGPHSQEVDDHRLYMTNWVTQWNPYLAAARLIKMIVLPWEASNR